MSWPKLPPPLNQSTYREVAAPAWAGDFSSREHALAGGANVEVSAFIPNPVSTTANGAHAQGVTVLTLATALGHDVNPGDRIYASATNQVIVVAKAAPANAVALTIVKLKTALAAGAALVYVPMHAMRVRSGTAVGRTRAERDAGLGYGPATTGDEEFYLVLFGSEDLQKSDAFVPYRHGSLVYTNLLPGFAGLSADVKTLIYANYECSVKQEPFS